MLRAIADHDLRRVLVFHNRIAAAHAFARSLPGTASQVTGDLTIPDLWSHAVDSTQKTWQRRHLLKDFDATSRRAVLSNVRVLNEGVDIPAIDAVVFAAARKSVIDAIQSIGRALRQQPGEGKKATLVIPRLPARRRQRPRHPGRHQLRRPVEHPAGPARPRRHLPRPRRHAPLQRLHGPSRA
ncbi:hypothetical protein DDE05_24215 [Streptomyces cavourensis]|nr:hypothetical protein DDE05_24215 [Streptomyces cavourensis]